MRYWLSVLLLSATTAAADVQIMTQILQQELRLAGDFAVCHGGGCTVVSQSRVQEDEWLQIVQQCEYPLADAAAERQCIAHSIAKFEQIVGAKTGTDRDRGGTFGNSAYPGQLDCNDEAINTTTYLRLMQMRGLLRYHDIQDIRRRGFFFNGWPHTTAVIRDRQTQQRYAVDAWFYDNGQPAVVVPFELWKTGWKPDDSAAR